MGISREQSLRLEEILTQVRNKDLGPLDAFLQIKQLIQPDESIDRLKKRFLFWTFELNCTSLSTLPPKERLHYLRLFLFEKKSRVLKRTLAPQILMGLALQNFANLTGLNLNFVLLGKSLAMKIEIDGECQYISLEDDGRMLGTQEVLDLIYDCGQVRRIDFVDLLVAYLECVQKHLDPRSATSQLLRVYDLILSLKIADPKTLLRRAHLHKELGLISESLADLKRYLNFQAPQPLAQSLKRIYSQLSSP